MSKKTEHQILAESINAFVGGKVPTITESIERLIGENAHSYAKFYHAAVKHGEGLSDFELEQAISTAAKKRQGHWNAGPEQEQEAIKAHMVLNGLGHVQDKRKGKTAREDRAAYSPDEIDNWHKK